MKSFVLGKRFALFIAIVQIFSLFSFGIVSYAATPKDTITGTVFEDFESISGWSTNSYGNLSIDTSKKVSGNASLKLKSVSAGETIIAQKSFGATNLGNIKNIEFNVYVPNLAEISYMIFYFKTNSNSYYYAETGDWELMKGWNKIRKTPSKFFSEGSPSWSNITGIEFEVFVKSSKSPVLNFDRIAFNATDKTNILFTFDDASSGVSKYAMPIMNARGIKGTTWVNKDLATCGDPDFMDVNTLKNLYANGWDVGNHTVHHPDDISKLTTAQKRSEYKDNQDWIESLGMLRGARHVCYPMGGFDDELLSILPTIGVLSGRTTIHGIQPSPVEDIYRLKCIDVGRDSDVNEIKGYIDEAVNTGSSIFFMFHDVAVTPDPNTEQGAITISTAKFTQIVDYVNNLKNKGTVNVPTISQWYNWYNNGQGPTATPTVKPTATATAKPTATPTIKPTATATAKPTAIPTVKPTATATAKPTATPTIKPTATATAKPTATPTIKPTATAKPTATPTIKPTATATAKPTATPTIKPTATATAKPTATPTTKPTATPVITPIPTSANITIDGDVSDWTGITAVTTFNRATGPQSLKVTNDSNYLYFLVEGNTLNNKYEILINSDNDINTGYQYEKYASSGCDYMIEVGGYLFYTDSNSWPSILKEGAGVTVKKTSNVLEARVPKSALINLKDTITVGYFNMTSNWSVNSKLPESGGMVTYKMNSNIPLPSPNPTSSTSPNPSATPMPNKISVDGNTSDWAGIQPVASSDVNSGAKNLKVTVDNDNLYFLIQGTNLSSKFDLLINSDNNADTGFKAWDFTKSGIEYAIESDGNLYSTNGSSWPSILKSNSGIKMVKGTQTIEISIPKKSLTNLKGTITLGYLEMDNRWLTINKLPKTNEFVVYNIQ